MLRGSFLLACVVLVGCSSGDAPVNGPYHGGLSSSSVGFVGASSDGVDGGYVQTTTGVGTSTAASSAGPPPTTSSSTSGAGASTQAAMSSSTAAQATTSTTTFSSTSSTPSAPTWTDLYNSYLAVGTAGNCDGSCHKHTECSSPSACFSWIGTGQHGGLTGTSSNPLFSWDNGTMPTNGPSSDSAADTAFAAWVAAGSKDN